MTRLTQTTDLMPTFLDYFGAPAPPHLHGASLRPAIEADQAVHVVDQLANREMSLRGLKIAPNR